MAKAECARAPLYHSGEMELTENATFESHLPDCPTCRERVSTLRLSKREIQKSLLQAPQALLQKTVNEVPVSSDGGELFGTLVKIAMIAAALWGAYRAYERFAPVPAADEAPAQTVRRTKPLGMPKAEPQPVRTRAPLVRGRSSRAERTLSSAVAMPPRPLDCESPAAIRAFKSHAWRVYGGGQPYMVYSADRYASCVCGAAAQNAGRPPAPPAGGSPRPEPACPEFAAGTVSQARYDRFMAGLVKTAKDYHSHLPLSRAQALTLAQCLCGAMPTVEGE